MNRTHGGGDGGGRHISGMRLVDQRNRDDEDLVLFREMGKREKDRIASLLQPVSEEFEPNSAAGNYALYRIASKKKGSGYEFFGENERNDYDWLKTPPATPLFPSLEMEAKATQLAVQREIPILQPLSRFSGNSAAPTKESTNASHQRKNISSTENKNTKITTIKIGKQSLHTDFITKTKARSRGVSPSLPSSIPAAQIYGFSNDLKLITTDHCSTSAARNPPADGNSSLSTQIKQFLDEPIPPNLRTTPTNRSTSAARNRPAINPTPTPPSARTTTTNHRSTSAARNRPASAGIGSGLSSKINQLFNDPPPSNLRTTPTDHRSTSAARILPVPAVISSGLSSQSNQLSKDPPPPNLRTTPTDHRSTSTTRGRSQNPTTHATHKTQTNQSRSPSVTRVTKADQVKLQERSDGNGNCTERGIFPRGIVGSKMVEKVMNARKYSELRENTKSNNTTGVGRNLLCKSSLDLALQYTEMQRDQTNSSHQGPRGRSLTRSDH